MAFSHLLVSALVALAGAQQEECLPTGECAVPSAGHAMLQTRSRAVAEKMETGEARDHKATSQCVGQRRKVAIFMDGTGNELNDKCSWLPNKVCETNIARMYRLAKEIPEAQQVSYYEPGVASSQFPDESYQFGIGTKNHFLRAYNWLVDNYKACDEIHLFGFSRGALSSRMLQGALHRVGLAVKGYARQAEAAHFASDASRARAFKASNMSQTVEVQFYGMFDGVLRTLLSPSGEHADVARFHMQMTSTVKTFAHAMALSEHREIYDTNELYTDPSTSSTQAWFVGQHADVGGGYPTVQLSNIAMGWVLDKAAEAGLLLPDNWRTRPENSANVLGDAYTELGLDAIGSLLQGINLEKVFKIATVRNPALCRAEMGKAGQKLLFHKSVQDRMNENNGWVPLQWCCSKVKAAMDAAGIEYITNTHYDTAATATKVSPWIKLSFRTLENADLSEEPWMGDPEFYLKVTNWHTEGSGSTPGNAGATGGCCQVLDVKPRRAPHRRCTGSWWGVCYEWSSKASQDFSDVTVVLPHEATWADEVMVELHEEDWVDDHDYLGRGFIKYSEFGSFKTLNFGRYGRLQVKAEFVGSDNSAKAGLGGNDYAQCLWLDKSTGLSRSTMCDVAHYGLLKLDWLFGNGPGSPGTCEDHIEDTKTGALLQIH